MLEGGISVKKFKICLSLALSILLMAGCLAGCGGPSPAPASQGGDSPSLCQELPEFMDSQDAYLQELAAGCGFQPVTLDNEIPSETSVIRCYTLTYGEDTDLRTNLLKLLRMYIDLDLQRDTGLEYCESYLRDHTVPLSDAQDFAPGSLAEPQDIYLTFPEYQHLSENGELTIGTAHVIASLVDRQDGTILFSLIYRPDMTMAGQAVTLQAPVSTAAPTTLPTVPQSLSWQDAPSFQDFCPHSGTGTAGYNDHGDPYIFLKGFESQEALHELMHGYADALAPYGFTLDEASYSHSGGFYTLYLTCSDPDLELCSTRDHRCHLALDAYEGSTLSISCGPTLAAHFGIVPTSGGSSSSGNSSTHDSNWDQPAHQLEQRCHKCGGDGKVYCSA